MRVPAVQLTGTYICQEVLNVFKHKQHGHTLMYNNKCTASCAGPLARPQ